MRNVTVCRECKHIGYWMINRDSAEIDKSENNLLCWVDKDYNRGDYKFVKFSDYGIPERCPYKLEQMVLENTCLKN